MLDILAVSNHLPKTYVFENVYDVIFPDRGDWAHGTTTFREDTLSFFTDGSRKDGSTGAGIFGPSCEISVPLGSTPTVFQAEIFAIEHCANICLLRNDLSNKNVFIYSDSLAALKALSSSVITSKLVLSCLNTLNLLGTKCKLTLGWVPGHSGVLGNEAADELARTGSDQPFIGPEPSFGLSDSCLKVRLMEWVELEKTKHFNSLSPSSHSRFFINYSKKRTQEVLELSKEELRMYVGLNTGFCNLNYHLSKIGLASDSTCRLCGNGCETPRHILCECSAASRTRLRHFGRLDLDQVFVRAVHPRKFLAFFKSLKLV